MIALTQRDTAAGSGAIAHIQGAQRDRTHGMKRLDGLETFARVVCVQLCASSVATGLFACKSPGASKQKAVPGRALQIQHDGQFRHVRHAQIARRVIVSQAWVLVSSGKSDAPIGPFRAHHEGRFATVTNVARDAMDAAASTDE